jgi:3D (Asp-Asp-Asp) domain-containing protein
MLHAPVSENKTQDKQSKTQSEPESERRVSGWAGYPALGLGGENGSSAGNERAQGWQPINLSTLSQGEILQRKCACGSSAGAAGTCGKCQSKEGMLQTKLSIGASDDKYEQEADRVADEVMRMPEPKIQRQVEQEEDDDDGMLQMKAISNSITPLQRSSTAPNQSAEVPDIVHDVLRSPGQPLDFNTRAFMKSRFGQSFGDVRVHTDAHAVESAEEMAARAYTVRKNIVFGAGQHAPETSSGRSLLAHELVHVLQQSYLESDKFSNNIQRKDNKKPKDNKKIEETPDIQEPVANKQKTKWLYDYDSIQAAELQYNLVKSLGLKVDEPVGKTEKIKGKEKNTWTFYYYPLTKEGAASEVKKKQAELGIKYTVAVKSYDKLRGIKLLFVEVVHNCPGAITSRTDFLIWSECYEKKDGDLLVTEFKKKGINAEVVELPKEKLIPEKTMFGVYYQILTESEAQKKGELEARQRPGYKEGMYEVKTSKPSIKISGKEFFPVLYKIETKCPNEYEEVDGKFTITAYPLAREEDFPEKPLENQACGLKGKSFRKDFLNRTEHSPYGVKLEGSGISVSGKFIQYVGNKNEKKENCFEEVDCPKTAKGTCAEANHTVAVDRKVIPLGSELLIEDIGLRLAEDTGGKVNGNHIDIYYGTTISTKEANSRTFKNKKVCKKKKK